MDLDARGLKCPMPLVKLSKSMKEAAVGEHITVTADDPAFPHDVLAWCRRTGHRLVSMDDGNTTALVAVVEKREV